MSSPLVVETAAAAVIGNELLSGKIQDQNLLELARLLRALGIRLIRAVVLPDDIDVIAREVALLGEQADIVFTSGGVGPTHDDVTVEAVARALGVGVERDPTLERMLKAFYGDACSEAHLRMALVPEGAQLMSTPDIQWPTIFAKNVFLLPGVPEIFKTKLDAVRAHVRGPRPFVSKAVFLRLEEAEITERMNQVVARHANVEVGSYPKWFEPSYKTKVTFDGHDDAAVARAVSDFLEQVAADSVVRVD